MIAAGSLFTSCVTNTEPQGIKDIREAKADYLESLAKLRDADAEKVKAEAAYVQAETALKQAEAAVVEAAAKAAEIAVELEDAAVQAKIAEIKAQAEIDAVKAKENLARAQYNLEVALKNLAANAKELTTEEKNVISRYTDAYSKYIEAVKKVSKAEVALYNATYKQDTCTTVEVAKAEYEQEKADAELQKAIFEVELAVAEELSEAQIADYEEWVAKYDALIAENEGFKYDSAEIHKELALLNYDNAEALAAFYKVVDEKKAAITKARAGFSFPKYEKALPVVSFKSGSGVVNVVENFAAAADSISLVTIADKKIKVAASTDKDVVEDVVDSLNIIIDALNREKVVVDQIVKDTTGIAALLAKTNKEYTDTKKALEAGVDKYEGIAKAQAKVDSLDQVITTETTAFNGKKDAFITKAKDFVAEWNTYAEKKTQYADSEKVFNAFVDVMKQRENIFPDGDDSFKYTYYKPTLDEKFVKVYKPDTIKFSELKYKDLLQYSYKDKAGTTHADVIGYIFNQGFGLSNTFEFGNVSKIKFEDDLVVPTEFFQKTFFNTYWLSITAGSHKGDGKMYKTGDNENAYLGETVAKAKTEKVEAVQDIAKAREDYYKNIYEKFWGVAFPEDSKDSLKINFTEKTYTDPKVLVTFSGKEGQTVFTPAKDKKDAYITWENVNYNDSSLALNAIKKQLGQNNIKIEGATTYTLYAKTLAVAQFASAAVNYKENTQALAELTTIVGEVETAFENAKAAVTAGSAKADSLEVALTGKKGNPIVNHNLTDFINPDGTFKLAGEQKTLAEKSLTDYAKTYAEIVKEGKTIDAKAEANNALAKIYADYIAELAGLQGLTQTAPDSVYQEIKEAWYGKDVLSVNADGNVEVVHINGFLDDLQDCIDVWAKEIKKAEAKIAKLEAGYDQSQIDIEEAQNDLAEAQEELEAAEAKLAAAKAAYEQVLANHGLAE